MDKSTLLIPKNITEGPEDKGTTGVRNRFLDYQRSDHVKVEIFESE